MDFWNTLQLAPTTDIRAIKKAYAVLLKQNRPDDNPTGFQQLHGAYQDALCWAEDRLDEEDAAARASVQPATPVTTAAAQHNDPAAFVEDGDTRTEFTEATAAQDTGYGCGDPNCEHCAAEAAWEKYLDEQWETLVQKVEDTLEDASRRNDPAAWHFLVESEALLDIDFKGAFAMRFLQRLLQMFSQQQESGEQLLEPAIVRHLNQLFWWSERRHHYDDYIDPDWIDDFMLWWQAPQVAAPAPVSSILTLPLPLVVPSTPASPPAPAIPYGNYYSRWLAMLIDSGLLFLLGSALALIFQTELPFELAGLLAIAWGYPLASALFEMSPLQGTPGKLWCKLKVCDRNRQPLGPFRALYRSLLFALSLYFIYITVIVNLLIWDGRLLHDRISGSMVLKR